MTLVIGSIMKILSFDTSNNLASVAIMYNGELLSYNVTEESSQQAEQLFLLIGQALQASQLQLADFDLISVTNGPGSFTGVRIGLAAALGLEVGFRDKFKGKIIALTNFQVLAWQAKQEAIVQSIMVILDARREQVYLQLFDDNLQSITNPKLVSVSDIATYLPQNISFSLVGDGVKFLSQYNVADKLKINADAHMLAKASEYYWQNKLYQPLVPLYVREPDALKAKIFS